MFRITQTIRRLIVPMQFHYIVKLEQELMIIGNTKGPLTEVQKARMREIHRKLGTYGPYIVPVSWLHKFNSFVNKIRFKYENRAKRKRPQ